MAKTSPSSELSSYSRNLTNRSDISDSAASHLGEPSLSSDTTHEVTDAFSFAPTSGKLTDVQSNFRLIANNFDPDTLVAGGKKSASKKKGEKAPSIKAVEQKIIYWSDVDKLHELCESGEECAELVNSIYEIGMREMDDGVDLSGKVVDALKKIAFLAKRTKDEGLIKKIVTDDGMIIDKLFDISVLADEWTLKGSISALKGIVFKLLVEEPLVEPKVLVDKLYQRAKDGNLTDSAI